MDVPTVENDGPAHFGIDGATLWAAAMLEETSAPPVSREAFKELVDLIKASDAQHESIREDEPHECSLQTLIVSVKGLDDLAMVGCSECVEDFLGSFIALIKEGRVQGFSLLRGASALRQHR